MSVEKTNKRCSVKNTDICNYLGCDGCEKCVLNNSAREYEKIHTNEIWQVTQTNLPENADAFHESETCFFCKKRPGNKKDGYAMVDIAHPEPAYEKGPFFGLGKAVRMPVGSLIQLPITICKECRRRHLLIENLKYFSLVAGFLIGLLELFLLQDTEYLQYSPEYIPIVMLLLTIAIFYMVGGWYAKRLVKKNNRLMYYNIFDIPEMQGFKEKGWFVFRDDKEKTRMYFSKKKPRKNFKFFWPREQEQETEKDDQA